MATCAACGHELAAGARFCFDCGTPLPDGQIAPASSAAPGLPRYPAPGVTAAAAPGLSAPPPAFSANKGRAMLVYAGLAILALVMIAFIPKITKQIDQLDRVNDIERGRGSLSDAVTLLREVEENDEAIETMNALLALSLVATGIVFLFWVHRAYKNLLSLNAGNLPSSPAFAVWSFIIPLANLVLPLLRMREIWQAGGPEGVNSRFTGVDWKTVAVPLVLPFWWVAFLVSTIGRYILQMSKPTDESPDAIARVQNYDSAVVAMFVVSMAVSVLCAWVVFSVTKRQNEAYGLMTAPPAVAPEPQPAWPSV
jgi:hypothetical protein